MLGFVTSNATCYNGGNLRNAVAPQPTVLLFNLDECKVLGKDKEKNVSLPFPIYKIENLILYKPAKATSTFLRTDSADACKAFCSSSVNFTSNISSTPRHPSRQGTPK